MLCCQSQSNVITKSTSQYLLIYSNPVSKAAHCHLFFIWFKTIIEFQREFNNFLDLSLDPSFTTKIFLYHSFKIEFIVSKITLSSL
ncbi:MAG: hypothetical protein LBQ24_02765 [Candidatus Peribacteria bacterium]|nr:hypothetical protein [Candidatus Peribacteria bacterium]